MLNVLQIVAVICLSWAGSHKSFSVARWKGNLAIDFFGFSASFDMTLAAINLFSSVDHNVTEAVLFSVL